MEDRGVAYIALIVAVAAVIVAAYAVWDVRVATGALSGAAGAIERIEETQGAQTAARDDLRESAAALERAVERLQADLVEIDARVESLEE